MTPMLYSQRQAFARMSPRHQQVHLIVWELYQSVAHRRTARMLWRLYRRTWPR